MTSGQRSKDGPSAKILAKVSCLVVIKRNMN